MNAHPGARLSQPFRAILLLLALVIGLAVVAADAGPAAAAAVPGTAPAADRGADAATPVLYMPLIFKAVPPCDAPPCLLSPPNGARITTLAPLFEWNAGASAQGSWATYLVSSPEWPQFYCRFGCRYPGSGTVSVRGTGMFRFGEYAYDANFKPGTRYSWHVIRCTGYLQEQCQESPTWTFTTPDTVTLPPAPAIIAPTTGSVVQGPLVKFEWSPVAGALDYEFCLVQDGDPPYSRYCMWLGSIETSLELSLSPSLDTTGWHWHIAALGAQGEGPGNAATFQVSGASGSATVPANQARIK